MAKVKKTKIEKAKKSTQSKQLPLDDMLRWRPVAEITERLFSHIGNKDLTAHELTEALAREKIRCMRRNVQDDRVEMLSLDELEAIETGKASGEPAGHRKLLPASFWAEHCFACSSNGDIRVALRPPPNHRGPLHYTWIAKWAFYLWQPDCVKAWPALAPQKADAREAEASEPSGRKPGPRPKKEWKLFIAYKLYILQQAGKPAPTAGELAELCQNELGHLPDESAINLWLRELGRLLG
jgi:hypothetical protein